MNACMNEVPVGRITLLAISLNHKRSAMNGMTEKTPESHECERQRVQMQWEQRRERQKNNAREGLNSAVKRENVVSEVVGLKKERPEAQK